MALEEYNKTGVPLPTLDSTDHHPLDDVVGSLTIKRAIRTLEAACEQLCVTLAPPGHTLVNRSSDYTWACLRVVIEAKIADALEGHPNGLHVSELAKAVNLEPGKLAGILRLLATKHCFREVTTDVFSNNRLSVYLRTSENLCDFLDMLTLEGPQAALNLYQNLSHPTKGHSYDPADAPFMDFKEKDDGFKGTFFEWQKGQPERIKVFGRAMKAMGLVLGSNASLENFPWANFSTVCDVGSGFGSFSIPLSKKFPKLKLTLQDLPATMEQARDVWNRDAPEAVQSGRAEFVPIDFLKVPPVAGKDIYYLRNIVHNWPDEQTRLILKHIAQAMDKHSRLVIHEYILQHVDRDSAVLSEKSGVEIAPEPLLPNFGGGNIRLYNQDFIMLLIYNARERTLEQFISIAKEVGLKFEKVWDLAEMSLLEFSLADD